MDFRHLSMKGLGVFMFWMVGGLTAVGQSPVADFSTPATACLNQALFLDNNSTNATGFVWDFCFNDLNQVHDATVVTTISGTATPTAISIVYDLGNWYGFLSSRDNGKLFRLDFGNSLENIPSRVDLGSFSITPKTLRFAKESGLWYAIGINDYPSSSSFLYRLSFPSGLTSTPAFANLGNLDSWDGLEGLDLAYDGTNWVAIVSSYGNYRVSLVNFGTSITNNPTVSDKLTLFSSSSEIDRPYGVKLFKDANEWFGLITAYNGGKINRLRFGSNLFSIPTREEIYSVPSPTDVSIQLEGDQYVAFISTKSGEVHRLNFGNSLVNSPTTIDLGSFGLLANTEAFDLVRSAPVYYGFLVNYVSGALYRIKFVGGCAEVSATQSGLAEPQDIKYNTAGNYFVELTARSSSGETNNEIQSVTITTHTPAAVDFTDGNNQCLGVTNTFTSIPNDGTITSFDWDFGDNNTATGGQVNHQFAATGNYSVRLQIASADGCGVRVDKVISIYNIPVASFNLPGDNPLCDNHPLTFTNTSVSDSGSNPSWQWFINGSPVSTTQNLSHSFSNTLPQDITLRAMIPGCFNESSQQITSLQEGPLVNFDFTGNCLGDLSSFTNSTTGIVTSYLWDFGDTQTSNLAEPTHTYSGIGNKNVTLTAFSPDGCNNTSIQTILISSIPQPDFTLDLPPFSCSGSPSQFNDATPNPTDSNLSSWAWSFGDAANGSSTQRNPLYTYTSAGVYSVGLTVSTNFGCSASIQKPITITPSPTASFVHTPACAGTGTQFTDTSTGSIKSWLWKIDNSTYTFSNPLQVFGGPGTYSAQLTVTDNNNCIAQATQVITVPFVQSPDFSAQSTCATKPAVFQDTTPVSTDPITSVSWDFGGQGSGSGSPAQFTFSVTGNFSVTMDARAQSGCVYSVTKTIAVVSPPIAGFTTSTDAGPVPLLVQFTNTSTNATSYLWRFHDKTNSTTTVPSPSFTFTELGEYIVDLDATGAQGCLDTFSKIINAVVPRVDAGLSGLQFIRDPSSGEYQALFVIDNAGNMPLTDPTILVEISGNVALKEKLNLTLMPGQSASHILSYSLLPGGLDYVCLSVDVAQDVSVYNNKECVSTTDETIVFQPYPNPANGELHFEWIAADSGSAQLTIFNSTGAKAFDRSVEASAAGLNQIRLDVSNLSPGMYLIVFNYLGQKKTFRFAIQ